MDSSTGGWIWHAIGRASFEKNIDVLEREQKVPESYVLEKKDFPLDRPDYPLRFDVEKQLVEGFAFISSHEPGARHVTAAAIEPKKSGGRAILRLAGNEGISESVRKEMKKLSRDFRDCAAKSK